MEMWSWHTIYYVVILIDIDARDLQLPTIFYSLLEISTENLQSNLLNFTIIKYHSSINFHIISKNFPYVSVYQCSRRSADHVIECDITCNV